MDIYNSGDISAKGNGVYLEYEEDNGYVNTIATKAAQGIYASGVDVVKHEGKIEVIGDAYSNWSGVTGIYTSGKSYYDSEEGTTKYEKVLVENSGEIKVEGNYGVGIKVENGDLVNTSNLEVTGLGSISILVSRSYDSNLNLKLENEGDIFVLGDGSNFNNTNAAVGISSSGVDIYNSGKIEIIGNADTSVLGVRGISLENSSYTNKVIHNEGNITLTGKGNIVGVES